MAAITFPMNPTDGMDYSFGGTDYQYDAANNRWLAQAAGGATVVVSQTRPDPTMGSAGDLWWYCGADGEDPGLFTLVEDSSGDPTTDPPTPGQFQWIQSSPGIAFESSSGGGYALSLLDEAPLDTTIDSTIAGTGTPYTIQASDIIGTGPVWVQVNGAGGGGGAVVYGNFARGTAAAGGAGGAYGFMLADATTLVGASLTVGAGGAGAFANGSPGSFGLAQTGTQGGTSTLSIDGATITATGGGGGSAYSGSMSGTGVPGTVGTGSASGSNAPAELLDINTDIDTYWNQFVVEGTNGSLTLAGSLVGTGAPGGGGGAVTTTGSGGTNGQARGGTGGAGSLQIVYQVQP